MLFLLNCVFFGMVMKGCDVVVLIFLVLFVVVFSLNMKVRMVVIVM